MENGYSVCFNEWALDKEIKNELGLLLIISSLCAEKGYCYASNKYLADLFKIDECTVSRKIQHLEEKNYITIKYEKCGCEIKSREIRLTKISIHDLQKCQSTIDENVKENNISINKINNNKKENIKRKDLELEFEEVWKEYPKKVGKAKSLVYYIQARNKGVDKDTILKAVINYAEEVKNVNEKYIKHGSTWFNGKYWEDEIIEKESEEERLQRLERELMEEENEIK